MARPDRDRADKVYFHFDDREAGPGWQLRVHGRPHTGIEQRGRPGAVNRAIGIAVVGTGRPFDDREALINLGQAKPERVRHARVVDATIGDGGQNFETAQSLDFFRRHV